MTDEGKNQRPNANYNLSKPDKVNPDAEQTLTFHYSRERRLEKAPKAVKDLNSKQNKQKGFNLLRPLIADKPRATLFFTIVILSGFIYIFSMLGMLDNSYSLEGTKLEISGTRYEGITIIVLKKTIKKHSTHVYSGAVDIAVSPAASGEYEDFPVFYHRIFFTLEPVEEYRFAVPFDSPDQLIVLQTEKSTLNIKLKPE